MERECDVSAYKAPRIITLSWYGGLDQCSGRSVGAPIRFVAGGAAPC